MAKSKYYAVKGPDIAQIFDNWPDCQAVVLGSKGLQFKAFASQAEAEVFAGLASAATLEAEQGFIAYVDGSFGSKSSHAGWAWVILKNGEKVASASGITPLPALSRNIDGELYACIDCLRYGIAQQIPQIILCHDYEGIAAWVMGRWKAKSEIAVHYQNKCRELLSQIKVHFRKVPAHSGLKWNEEVDRLAKNAILNSLK